MSSLFLSLLLVVGGWGLPDLRLSSPSVYLSADSIKSQRLFVGSAAVPKKIDVLSLGPRLAAASAVVVDASSGAILFEKNAAAVRPLASLTKLMTALVFLESNPKLSQVATMAKDDDREGGRTFIRPLESATLENYLTASLIASANNATMVLARSTGDTAEEFIGKMNTKARQLGMSDTIFLDPTGLSEGNISTGRDLAKLLRAAAGNPIIRRLTTTSLTTIKLADGTTRPIANTDNLLSSMVDITLGKTGYLDEALYNLAVTAKLKNSQEVYVVVLGAVASEERFQDAKNLIVWTQGAYAWK
ncbi:MAG: serine hydrolase [Candidatus Komeilibacteria bacterium]|nr:serine hydrolase [Candidatus Komeilibacteria bacterium]